MGNAKDRATLAWASTGEGSLTHPPHRNAHTAAFEHGIGVNRSVHLAQGVGRELGLVGSARSPDGPIDHDDAAAPFDLVVARGVGLAVSVGALLWLVLAALAFGLPLRLWPRS